MKINNEDFEIVSQDFKKDEAAIIYKFRDWNNLLHKEILLFLELFVATPKQLNDPFDSQVNFELDQANLKKEIDEQSEVIKAFSLDGKIIKTLTNSNDDIIQDSKQSQEGFYNSILDEVKNRCGIVSFSQSNNNILLWSHYANNHTGFAIGFDRNRLIQEVRIRYSIDGYQIGKVNYYSEYLNISLNALDDINLLEIGSNLAELAIFSKSINWQYEEEIRLMFRLGNSKLKISPSCIKEIIFGCKMEQAVKNEIKSICKEKAINANFFQAELSTNKYELILHQVD